MSDNDTLGSVIFWNFQTYDQPLPPHTDPWLTGGIVLFLGPGTIIIHILDPYCEVLAVLGILVLIDYISWILQYIEKGIVIRNKRRVKERMVTR